jgi:valyl-tRNA synthetase
MRIEVWLVAAGAGDRAFVEGQAGLVSHLAGLSSLSVVPEAAEAPQTIKQVIGAFEARIPMAGLFDLAAETARLTKELGKIDAEMRALRAKLDNPSFVERAKPEVVAQSRDRVAELEARRTRVTDTLREMGVASS